MAKRYIGGALAVILMVGIIAYTFYHSFSSFGSDVNTATVSVSSIYTVATGTGCIIRNEAVMTTEAEGVKEYLVSDGERVRADSTVAHLYEVPAVAVASLTQELQEANEKMAFYESAMQGQSLSYADADGLQTDVYAEYGDLIARILAGQYSTAGTSSDTMLQKLNQYDVLTGREDFTSELQYWTDYRDALLDGLGDPVDLTNTGYGSGYFYYAEDVDGYESMLGTDHLNAMTPADLSAVLSAEVCPDTSAYGKMVYDSRWYLAVCVTQDEAESLQTGTSYPVTFSGQETTITMSLLRLSSPDESGQVLLIFTTQLMPPGFEYTRIQSVQIRIGTVSGYRIPESALVLDGGTYGVYVLDGSVVAFCRVHIILEGDGYVLVSTEDPEPDSSVRYLKTNDLLIVSGEKLYDGKVLS